jgi:hypothetical protein
LLFRVAYADPEAEQNTCGHKQPIGGHAEVADSKKFREH